MVDDEIVRFGRTNDGRITRRLGEPKNRGEDRVELLFELSSEAWMSRFVVIDLVVDLDDGQPVNP